MDNFITSLIGIAVFLAFIIGLAFSIHSWPFSIIVASVSIMILVEFYQSVKKGFEEEKNKSNKA
jgi:4-hydroxybenzoate polyprenyltransferase